MNRNSRCLPIILACSVLAISSYTARASDAPPGSGPVPSGPPTAVDPIPTPTPPAPPVTPPPPADSKATTEPTKPKRTRRPKAAAGDPDTDEFAPDELLAATEYVIGKLEAETESNATNIRARNALYHLREALPHLRELAGT